MNPPIKRVFPQVVASRKVPDEIKATIGKLARDPHGPTNSGQNIRIPDQRVLGHVANKTINNINDARNMFQVLPDMNYAREIICSATISPGNLTESKVIYSVDNEDLDTNLTGPMLREVQGFFDDTYRIKKLLPEILSDVLFEKGSYPLLIMPESSIDQIINADSYKNASLESAVISLESHLRDEVGGEGVYQPFGVLGFPGKAGGKGVSFESLGPGDEYVQHSYVAFPSMESHGDPKDLGRRNACDALNLLAAKNEKNFVVTDNYNVLKRPMVLETKRKLSIRRIYGGKLRGGLNRKAAYNVAKGPSTMKSASFDGKVVSISTEDITSRSTLAEVESAFYSQRRYKHIPVQPVLTKTQVGADTYGHPVVMHLAPESVIPIHVPGNPAEHVAYFVLLDINGNPLNITAHDNYYDDIRNQMTSNDAFSSQMLQTVRRGLDGQGTIANEIIEEMTRIHAETIEGDLLSRLRAGAIEGEYELSRTDHISQVMFSRHLKGQKTVMLYVPAEMMTYIAFDYNEFGVGKSLLEDAKILGSIRAALMLSNTLASINNAAGGKTIAITLDPKDENPAETVEFLLSEHAKVNSEGYSRIIGQTHPLGLADQIQNHGVNVTVEGNSRYPETKFDVQRREGTASPIDGELEKTMRDRHFQVFGLSPEVADGVNAADFATTVVQNNLMLLKRVIANQEKLEPFLCDIVRQYTLNSGILLDILRKVVDENKKYLPKGKREKSDYDDFIYEFIMSVMVELPTPEVNDIAKEMEEYNAYSDGLEKIIDAYMSEDMFITDATYGIEEIFPQVKKNVIAEFQRRWLRKRGIMQELDIFNTLEEDESPAFNFMEINVQHMDGLVTSLMKYMKTALKSTKKKTAEKLAIDKLKEDVQNLPTVDDGLNGGDDQPLDELDENGNPIGGDDLGLGGDDAAALGTDDDGLGGIDGLDDGLDAAAPVDGEPAADDADNLDIPGMDDAEAPAGDDPALAAADAELPADDAAAALDIPEIDGDTPAADATADDALVEPVDGEPVVEEPVADAPLEEPEGDVDAPPADLPPAEPGDAEIPEVIPEEEGAEGEEVPPVTEGEEEEPQDETADAIDALAGKDDVALPDDDDLGTNVEIPDASEAEDAMKDKPAKTDEEEEEEEDGKKK